MPLRPTIATLAMLTLASPMSHAQTAHAPKQLTEADYARAEAMLAHKLDPLVDGAAKSLSWQPGNRVLWVETRAGQSRLRGFDAANGRALPAIDHASLAEALAKASGQPVAAGEFAGKLRELRLDGDDLHFSYAGDDYACKRDGACLKQEKPARTDGDGTPVKSPDGKREVFIRGWNLWLRDIASGAETPLTRDGAKDYGYATDNAGWVHSDRAIVAWSPGSDKIATFRHDGRRVNTMTMVGTNVGAPEARQWKYPFAGDEHVFMIERVVIDLAGRTPRVVRLRMPADFHRSTSCDHVSCNGGWEDVQWAKDGRSLAFVSTDRGHKSAQLRVADAATGQVRDVYLETVETQFESGIGGVVNWRWLPESNEFLWWTQKSNWGHLYLHDLATGREKHAITRGDWNVSELLRLDEASRTVWFHGVGREPGRDPYFKHFYKASLDGGDVRLLTPEDADHRVQISDGGEYFIDTHSTSDSPPISVLRRMSDGAETGTLARADIARLKAAGWRAPEKFTVKGRDGRTDVYGMMWKPSHFDAKRKYPIVNYIYPGPQTGSIRTRGFATAQIDHQALAELGFIVVAMDGMGTPWRSKAFQDAYYGHMIDNTLPDQVAGMKQLAARHSWIDLERAGIWGHSGGGNATATAMFQYPDFFKVGISEAGNHDNLSYEDDWAERYHGLMAKKPDGTSNYTGQDNAAHAANLKGKLFLIHGMLDDNVPVQNTLLVVDALTKANKDFDLLLLPQARHGFGQDGWYVMRRRWDYFVRHLLGAEPPKPYEIKPPAP
ncbi:S9 family peptidase [Lysobacter pythonis]|uniref:S9 family peptidase n=1 Tax=Solilutibacter pythonis TaxID=2483112 RepID=A0A3M2HZW7_9GAMM|nr:S9 family peptidase [Lysobacter pythonis]RMH93190.1 S9 family peptidase [Lysobacter pythonis]